jgi:hypothetical protein
MILESSKFLLFVWLDRTMAIDPIRQYSCARNPDGIDGRRVA